MYEVRDYCDSNPDFVDLVKEKYNFDARLLFKHHLSPEYVEKYGL